MLRRGFTQIEFCPNNLGKNEKTRIDEDGGEDANTRSKYFHRNGKKRGREKMWKPSFGYCLLSLSVAVNQRRGEREKKK